MDEFPHFVIGHHDPKRPQPVTSQTVQDAHAANYDMLTSPITSPHFQSRVLTLLSSSLSQATSPVEDITKTKNASPVVIPPLTPADTPLTPDDSISQIIGISSSWIDLTSPDPIVADISRQVLNLELAYAAFCGITYLLIPGPNLRGHGVSDSAIAQYARAIMDALSQAPYIQIYIWQSILDHSEEQIKDMGDLSAFARPQFLNDEDLEQQGRLDLFGTWEAWDIIRSICKYHARLGVALSIPKLLPPVAIQSRWYSEPVRLLTLDNKIFTKNAKGYPVLSRAHQAMISRFMRLRTPPWFLLCDVGPVPTSDSTDHNSLATSSTSAFPTITEAAQNPQLKDPTPQLSYMRNLQTKQPILTPLDKFGAGYQDYLQAPLQPLTVNLESITYEVFEKDPIKYAWYERAIARALHDWIEQGKPTSNPDGRVVVAVVGAGRGPLVTRALKASEDVSVEIDMWALEKNPNAFVLLQRHNETIWNNRVKLVKSDMRTWKGPIRTANTQSTSRIYNTEQDDSDDQDTQQTDDHTNSSNPAETGTFTGSPSLDSTYILATSQPADAQPTPYKIDILISELLGSFADNELSPECLDGVQHLMNPVHGISIPASYTAHLTPIAAPKLYADITHGMTSTTPNAAEIPYVVMLNAIDYLSTAGGSDESVISSDVAPGSNKPQSPSSLASPPSYSKAHTHHQQHHHHHHHHHQQQQQVGIDGASSAAPTSSPTPTPQPIVGTTWSFQHPNPLLPSTSSSEPTPPLSNAHNARHSTLTFPIRNRGTCHGLAGYFETVLYKGVELSTNPVTMDAKSEGMISWFPIYFPLKVPLTVPDASELRVTMWRKTDDRRVWYEWIVDVFILGGCASGSGDGAVAKGSAAVGGGIKRARRVRVGGSELHSSEKDACMM